MSYKTPTHTQLVPMYNYCSRHSRGSPLIGVKLCRKVWQCSMNLIKVSTLPSPILQLWCCNLMFMRISLDSLISAQVKTLHAGARGCSCSKVSYSKYLLWELDLVCLIIIHCSYSVHASGSYTTPQCKVWIPDWIVLILLDNTVHAFCLDSISQDHTEWWVVVSTCTNGCIDP